MEMGWRMRIYLGCVKKANELAIVLVRGKCVEERTTSLLGFCCTRRCKRQSECIFCTRSVAVNCFRTLIVLTRRGLVVFLATFRILLVIITIVSGNLPITLLIGRCLRSIPGLLLSFPAFPSFILGYCKPPKIRFLQAFSAFLIHFC